MSPNALHKPLVLTIAANDSAGMAGIAMDIRTQQAFATHTMVAVTANTAQNSQEVVSINAVDVIVLKEQLEALKQMPIAVVKVGLVCNIEQARVIASFIIATGFPMVLDPVLFSTSGTEFFKSRDIAAYVDVLLPLCTLVTPNLEEASLLTNLSTDTAQDVELAAESMLLFGAKHVLIKGGHSKGTISQDYFASDDKSFWLSSPRQLTRNTRGTGCALASSISSCVALGYSMYDAVVIGKMAINQGLRQSYKVGDNKGPIHITHFPDKQRDIPLLSESVDVNFKRDVFPDCNQPQKLGLYPVVDSAAWVQLLLEAGVTTIQLRVKDLHGEELEEEIEQAIAIAREYDARLFINDFWELAIKHQAYGVHLGQEDLESADIDAIQEAGLRLGLSTHCHYEVARALQYKPSYLACGPVYHTNTKQMPWTPHDVQGLSYWRKAIDYPLVAIGGINASRLPEVVATGVDSAAMITAITLAEDPEAVTKEFLKIVEKES